MHSLVTEYLLYYIVKKKIIVCHDRCSVVLLCACVLAIVKGV